MEAIHQLFASCCFIFFFLCVCGSACVYHCTHYSSLLSKQSYLGAVPASIFYLWDKEQDLATSISVEICERTFFKNVVICIYFSSYMNSSSSIVIIAARC
uniref:Secreted peptide n=1 Tax=Rhipicephalus pulchellus TaxID=72859 RepID=L7M208_RHIPC